MTEIKIIVPGEPVPQGRPRFSRHGNSVRTYDPLQSRNYKRLVAIYAAKAKSDELLEGPLEIEIQIYKKTLQSFSKKKKRAAESKLLRPITKPDIDNYIKGIIDALKGIAWKDDSQIVKLNCEKFYSSSPRAEIIIKEFTENTLF